VQDFRALNNQSYTDKYLMKDVSECIGEIGGSGSTIFSTIDLTAGFWQMILHPRAHPYTAFTVPGMGQFQWITSPMGLLGCPASFQRLMETVVNGLANVIIRRLSPFTIISGVIGMLMGWFTQRRLNNLRDQLDEVQDQQHHLLHVQTVQLQ
jgi:hypothetical protein